MVTVRRTTLTVHKDPFNSIHALLKRRKYSAVLQRMFHANTSRLKREYRTDSNHAWYIVGDVLFRKAKFKPAAEAFRKSLRSRPNDSEAAWALGNVYSEMAKPDLAERYFRRALRHDRTNDSVRYNLGNALFDQKKFKSAIDVYRTVKRSSPKEFKLARKNIERAKARLGQKLK